MTITTEHRNILIRPEGEFFIFQIGEDEYTADTLEEAVGIIDQVLD